MFLISLYDLPTHFTSKDNYVSSFINLLTSKWKEIYNKPGVFQYKLNEPIEKILQNNYLLQLNPDRGSKRRLPEDIKSIYQPFDHKKFNFNKISSDEVITELEEDNDTDVHKILVNVSPISKYHSLLCPSVSKCLPQMMTRESLVLALKLMFVAQDRNLRIGFNGLCALASVNHLHYHLLMEKNNLPIETVKCKQLHKTLHIFEDYPIPGFCWTLSKSSDTLDLAADVFRIIQVLIQKNIAHNMMITRGQEFCGDQEVLRVVIWPRKSSCGVKQLSAFNVALCELAGWFPVYDEEQFHKLKASDVEEELNKWKIDNFYDLCKEIKCIL